MIQVLIVTFIFAFEMTEIQICMITQLIKYQQKC